jgi:hypothetical protein
MNKLPRPIVATRVVLKQGIRRVKPYAPKVFEGAFYSCVPTLVDDAIHHTHTEILHSMSVTLSTDLIRCILHMM